jgi:membrane fusion protein, multidrug efflux system
MMMLTDVTRVRCLTSAVAMIVLAGCAKPPAPPKLPIAVTIATSERTAAPYIVQANGVVEPMQSVAVQSQVSGVLTAVHFSEGAEVQAGQLLFEIDPRPYEAALRQSEAVLARDRAQAENAKRDAVRFAALVEKDYVTKSQADQAAANADALSAVVKADSAAVASAQFNLDNASIRAPVSGKTGGLLIRRGNLVRPGAEPPLVVINQIRPILVRFAVPDRDFPLVQRYVTLGGGGRPLRTRVSPGRDNAGPSTEGTLSFVDNGVDTTTGTVTLKARFENADRMLWPGQFVQVSLEVFVEANAVLVPSEAVQTGQDGAFVFVVDRKNEAEVRPVVVGRLVGDKTLIERGLEGGERVVTDGHAKLSPGSKVDIKATATSLSSAKGGGSP